MRKLCTLFIILTLSSSGLNADDNLVAEQAKINLRRAMEFFRSISTNGGYVGIYSSDLQQRYGEATYEKAKDTEIWVQPPGTPTIGESFLRAYRVTGENSYLEAASDAAHALAWGQRAVGGWDHRVDVSHLQKGAEKVIRKDGNCAFDDNITQGALSFLIKLDECTDESWLTESIELGIGFMKKSQFENGAWPQWYPLRGGYHDFYTFNDNAINDCIRVMLEAHRAYGREDCLQTAKRGGDFIILSQMPAPQSGWAQQYSHDLKAAWARSFEPPGICSAATSRNLRTLVDLYLYTKDEKFLAPIPKAIQWLEDSRISDNTWARLYEVGTNKPIYGDRTDGNKIFYDYDRVSEKERTSYAWRGSYGIPSAVGFYQKAKSMGPEQYAKERDTPITPEQRKNAAGEMVSQVTEVMNKLDDQGRWLRGDMLYSQDFVQNFNRICQYLEYVTPTSAYTSYHP
jgi:hypothetical protein